MPTTPLLVSFPVLDPIPRTIRERGFHGTRGIILMYQPVTNANNIHLKMDIYPSTKGWATVLDGKGRLFKTMIDLELWERLKRNPVPFLEADPSQHRAPSATLLDKEGKPIKIG